MNLIILIAVIAVMFCNYSAGRFNVSAEYYYSDVSVYGYEPDVEPAWRLCRNVVSGMQAFIGIGGYSLTILSLNYGVNIYLAIIIDASNLNHCLDLQYLRQSLR